MQGASVLLLLLALLVSLDDGFWRSSLTAGALSGNECECEGLAVDIGALGPCSNSSGPCEVVGNVDLSCNAPFAMSCSCDCRVAGDFVMKSNSSISCDVGKSVSSFCSLNLDVMGMVSFEEGAVLAVSTLRIRSKGDVQLERGSKIDSTGLGLSHRSEQRKSLVGYGGSNGGRGGHSSCAAPEDLVSPMIGDPVTPWVEWLNKASDTEIGFGFGGSSFDVGIGIFGGRGGGRIFLHSDGDIVVNGLIAADGTSPPRKCPLDCGSGAGGTIVLNATNFVGKQVEIEKTLRHSYPPAGISVVGGETWRNNTGAGGGGRIAVYVLKDSSITGSFDFSAFGGSRRIGFGNLGFDGISCMDGAAGTIVRASYVKSIASYVASLQISNCQASSGRCTTSSFAAASTPLSYDADQRNRSEMNLLLLQVDINKYASVDADILHLDDKPDLSKTNFTVEGGMHVALGRLTVSMRLQVESLDLSSGSILRTKADALVFLTERGLLVDNESSLRFEKRLLLECKGNVVNNGEIHPFEEGGRANTENAVNEVRILALNVNLTSGSSLVSDKISILAEGEVRIGGQLSATFSPICAKLDQRKFCQDLFLKKGIAEIESNYSLMIVTFDAEKNTTALHAGYTGSNVTLQRDIFVEETGDVSSRSILLCGNMIRVAGKVSASGQGCLADAGPGAGCTSPTSAGGGGGHGGYGGSGIGCEQRGAIYDSRTFPILSGSGGGSGQAGTAGGNGGGVLMIGASEMLQIEGQISSDGFFGNGQDIKHHSAGGGGSGGSVTIQAPTFCSVNLEKATISANGGDGGVGGGGGGGGGRIAVNFADEFGPLAIEDTPGYQRGLACTSFGNFTADITVEGGKQGKFSNELSLRKEQEQWKRAEFRNGLAGSINSPNCSEGHGSSWCSVCAFGCYKDIPGPEPCSPCAEQDCISSGTCDWMAEGATQRDCPVICNPGYVLPKCITPLENLIESMGGIVVFAIVVAGIGLLVVLCFACVCTRVEGCPGFYANAAKVDRRRNQRLSGLFQHRRELGFHDRLSEPLLRDDTFVPSLEDSPGLTVLDDEDLRLRRANVAMHTDTRNASSMTEVEVPFHITRIYFRGRNSPLDHWHMPEILPPVLTKRNMIIPDLFEEMVGIVNELAQHPPWTLVLQRFLEIACYPLGYLFGRRQRLKRARAIRDFLEREYDHSCVRSARARALMNTFKFGCDSNGLIGFVDVLAASRLSASEKEERMPMLIFVAGDGSYWAPFNVDESDVLVRAVPQLMDFRAFIDDPWMDLIDQLNATFRQIDPDLIELSAQSAIVLLERIAKDFDEPLGGLRVRLGMFPVPGGNNDTDSKVSQHLQERLAILLTCDLFDCDEFDIGAESAEALSRSMPGTFEPRASTLVNSTTSLDGASDVSPANPIISTRGGTEAFLLPEKRTGAAAVEAFEAEERMRAENESKVSMSDADFHGRLRKKASMASEAGGDEAGLLLERRGSVQRTSIREQALNSGNQNSSDQLNDVDADIHRSLLQPPSRRSAKIIPFSGVLLRLRLPGDDDIDSDDGSFCGICDVPPWLYLSHARRSLGILVNRKPKKRSSPIMFRLLLTVFVSVDWGFTFYLLTTFFCVNSLEKTCIRFPFFLVAFVYPFALVLGPLLGLTFVVFPLSGVGRHYATWNALSMINVFVALGLCLSLRERFSIVPILACLVLILLKLFQSRAVDLYIAILEMN